MIKETTKRHVNTVIIIVLAVALAVVLLMIVTRADPVTPLEDAIITTDDMNKLAPYTDEETNEKVSEALGGSATAKEWLAEYVELDPEFNNVLIEVLGVSAID